MYCNSRRADFWSWRVNLICFFLLRFQDEVSFSVGGVVIHILHLLCLSREPPFPGLSTEPSSHYGEHLINAKKKKKWNVILLEWGGIQKDCALGCTAFTRSQNKYPDFNVRPNRVVQSLWRWDVELENVNRCGGILMHFWKDKWLSCCCILEFTPSPYQKYDARNNSPFISISQSVWRAKGAVIL